MYSVCMYATDRGLSGETATNKKNLGKTTHAGQAHII